VCLFPSLFVVFSILNSVNIQLNCHLAISSSRVLPSVHLTTMKETGVSVSQTVLSCVALFPGIWLFIILPLGSIMESKRTYKSYNEVKESINVIPLGEKIRQQISCADESSNCWPNIQMIFDYKLLIFRCFTSIRNFSVIFSIITLHSCS
jgi:hypothetical protein